jgi:hypothetical protein
MSERHPGWCPLSHEARPDGGVERVLCVVSENSGPHGESVVDWILSDVVSDLIDPGEHHYLTAGHLGIGYFGFTAPDIALEMNLLHAVFHLIHDSEAGQAADGDFAINPYATFVESGRRWASTDELP